ncbi:MAG: FAD-dependent oxidoreductase [Candidatus Yanofskybacteria bacterium]|nr:FAD-dependent oxidoreductase [Candidatus Yanofskybacteria bacterium]
MMKKKQNNSQKAKIAVVGGGIFGVTAAVRLARAGFSVDLFEREKDILQVASGINQFRLHRGYHYPRSLDTMRSCLRAEESFLKEYGSATIGSEEHYYCIAKEGSLVSAQEHKNVCQKLDLKYIVAKPGLVNHEKLELSAKGEEKRIDPTALRKICWQKLNKAEVNVRLGEAANHKNLKKYDFTVIATYAMINELLPQAHRRNYQFELCEKPVVRLPRKFNRKCFVVMDGPFMCVDPFSKTGMFLLGNVVHAIHQTNIGPYPKFDPVFKKLLNKGIIKNPPVTNFSKFIESGSEFIPDLSKAEHVGSMFTFRTVLPHKEKTDERPTVVSRIDPKTITIFSGKIGNCVEAADEVLAAVNKKFKTL